MHLAALGFRVRAEVLTGFRAPCSVDAAKAWASLILERVDPLCPVGRGGSIPTGVGAFHSHGSGIWQVKHCGISCHKLG